MSAPTVGEVQAAWTRRNGQTSLWAGRAVVNLLADGRPVTQSALAAATGWSAGRVAAYFQDAQRAGRGAVDLPGHRCRDPAAGGR